MRNQLLKLRKTWMTKTTVEEERSYHGSTSSGKKRQAEMKEALRFMSYVNRLLRTSIMQSYRVV